jgi:hypothetical protein
MSQSSEQFDLQVDTLLSPVATFWAGELARYDRMWREVVKSRRIEERLKAAQQANWISRLRPRF